MPSHESANEDDVVDKLNHLDIVDDVQTPDPSAFLPFESHQHALDALKSVGYNKPQMCLSFSSSELVKNVGEILKDEGICVMDMTSTVPETASAAYQSLTIAGFTASASCRKDKNCAFVIQKTEFNTPSFLFGSHWASVQAIGKNATAVQIETKPTPVAYVFFRERQISIPSTICDANVKLAARIVAFEITMDASYFSCSVCGTPFVTHEGGDMQIAHMATTLDGQMFLRSCALKFVESECDK